MIGFHDLCLRRNGRLLLDRVGCEIADGCVTVILGMNGAGKSSMARLLAGEWRPCGGSLLWDGMPLDKLPAEQVARRRGVVPQSSDFRFSLTLRETVALGRYPHRHAGTPGTGPVEEAMAAMDVLDLADRPVTRLSGGERKRAVIARALAQLHEARRVGNGLFLLDEPTAHLDLPHQERLLRLLRDCARDGLMVCVVLHDLHLARRLADRVLLLKAGRIAAAGSPSEILQAAPLSEFYGMTLIPATGPVPFLVPA